MMTMTTNKIYHWEYNDKSQQFMVTEMDGIPVRVTRVFDDSCDFAWLMENYEYLVFEADPVNDLTDPREYDYLYENDEIDADEHMKCAGDGYAMIKPNDRYGTKMLVDVWESIDEYMKLTGIKNREVARTMIKDAIERIEGWLNDLWHYEYLHAEILDKDGKPVDGSETDTLGSIESYLFDEPENAMYVAEVINEILHNVTYNYKQNYNRRQLLLDI
jgi:hypothetical protein